MSEDGFRVRVAKTGDVPAIVELSGLLFLEDAGERDAFTDVGWLMREGEEYFVGFIATGGNFCLVAESEGEVIGYLAARSVGKSLLRPVDLVDLESIYVRENHRSSGVGDRLVREFMELSRKSGAQRISVTAYASNKRAIRFYEKIGFSPKSLSMERGV